MMEAIALGILKKVGPQILKGLGKQTLKTYQQLKAKVVNASHQYDKNYRERHGKVKVFCVGMREAIPLEDVYVGVQFLDERNPSKYRSREDLEKAFRERSGEAVAPYLYGRQDAIRVANDKRHLMVLGPPGVGKSTFLRKVGLEALKEKSGDFMHKCIPVFLELKRFTGNQVDIEALITHEFEICGYPYPMEMVQTALKSGKLLILFDGLDEVPAANVDNVVRAIADFVDRYRQNRFIASCRIAAYKGGFTQFSEVEMADFSDSQVQGYIKNWFASTSDPNRRQLDREMETGERCWQMLNEKSHQATKELARNPLLLTLLCMVYDNTQNFPRNRVDLYEKALNIFLEEWMAEKRVRQDYSVSQYLDISSQKRMLAEIAAKNYNANRFFFSEAKLVDQINEFGEGSANTPPGFNASQILETIRVDQGLFVERLSGFYSFSHLTFQEYLTANYIVGDTRSIQGLVTTHLHDVQWREVFLLTSGLMREADDLLVAMTDEASKAINTDRLRTLFRWAKCVAMTSDNSHSVVAKRAFAIRQFFSVWMLHKFYGEVKNLVDRSRDINPNSGFLQDLNFYRDNAFYTSLNGDLYLDLGPEEIVDLGAWIDGVLNLYLEQKLIRYRSLNLFAKLYLDLELDLYPDPDLNFYQDFYQYTDADFYCLVSLILVKWFNLELDARITLLQIIEQMKIFVGVDLQRMVRRFNEQRKFINAAKEGKRVRPLEESIHATWLSVLHITDDMLSISRQEIENYIRYLRDVQLIIECKEAAGRVTPHVWRDIEDRLMAWDGEEIEN